MGYNNHDPVTVRIRNPGLFGRRGWELKSGGVQLADLLGAREGAGVSLDVERDHRPDLRALGLLKAFESHGFEEVPAFAWCWRSLGGAGTTS